MVKKTRKKFFFIITAMLLLLYAVVSFSMFLIIRQDFYKKELTTLNLLINISEQNPLEIQQNLKTVNGIIIFKHTGIGAQEHYSENFSEDTVKNLSQKVKNVKNGYVRIDNFSLLIKDNLAVAIDATENIAQLKNTFLRVVEGLGILFVLLEGFTFLLVRKTVKPLAESLKKQKEFISDASHELNTPITIVQANCDILLSEDKDNKWLNGIKDQTKRMSALIQDMLSLSRLNETTLVLQKNNFNLSDTINGILLSFDAIAFEQQKSIIGSIEPDILYLGDQTSIKKIAEILIENAIKYSDGKEEIKVALYKKDNKTVFTVQNSGSKVEKKERKKIFERFYRGENSRNRETGGSGLGLAIAKDLATYNKWKISADIPAENYLKITVVM
ncbi:MAG: hypothetical protein E7342_02805 [Clostridiales bacterium]|nr:hypothetical protein [Clostridiales bacterium]